MTSTGTSKSRFVFSCSQRRFTTAIALACALSGAMHPARAADITVQPAAGSGFVIKDAGGMNERLRVQESGAVSLPGVVVAAAQSQGLCMSAAGQLGPCSGGTGTSYTAATGLMLSGTTFSVAPTYRLPQGCAASQIAQWDGAAWNCANVSNASLPAGTVNQTLRYDASNALVANNLLQAFADGGLVAGGVLNTGSIPATGSGARLMWYPAKAAFRVGLVDAAQWDDANVGSESTAMGYHTIASGVVATALGSSTIASGSSSTALGGGTTASGYASTSIGFLTTASGNFSTAMGKETTASGRSSTAMGETTNAGGDYSIAMGSNATADGKYSVAIGRNVSSGGYIGSFIYGDASSGRGTSSNSAHNQFMVFASGGVTLATSPAGLSGTGAVLAPGSSSWAVLSDRDAKTAVQSVDVREVLKKVAALPLNTWQYKTQDAKYRHMGPMAQDFYAAFRLGESDKGIDTVDADGVALAAIQGLNALLVEKDAKAAARLDEKDREMAALRNDKEREVAALRSELKAQKTRVSALELLTGNLATDLADMKAQLAMSQRPSAGASAVAFKQP